VTSKEMESLFNLVLAGWASQRQRLSDNDLREMAKLYAAGLMDLEFETTKAAVIRIVHTSKFLPTVAEIREAAGVVLYGDQITGLTAWGEVIRAIGRHGAYKRPGTTAELEQGDADFVIENPITLRVIRTLSWSALCSGTIQTQMADRARFADEYDTIAGQERKNAQASPGFKSPALQIVGSEQARPREVEWKAPLGLPSGEERSKMLHDILDSARHNAPQMFSEIANAVLKDRIVMVDEKKAELPCSCTQYHGIDEFQRCVYCRRDGSRGADGRKLGSEMGECECIEMFDPLDYMKRCPNCGLYDVREREAAEH
jgi:hypothetical protein